MLYSPLLDLYFRHEKHVHDFLVQLIIILVVYLTDAFAIYEFKFNYPPLSLLVFIISYIVARYIIRKKGIQKLFGGFANYGMYYCFFLSIGLWFIYYFFIRLPKFTLHP